MSSSDPQSFGDDPLEAVLESVLPEFFDLDDESFETRLDEVEEEHGAAVRERIVELRDLGLLGRDASTSEGSADATVAMAGGGRGKVSGTRRIGPYVLLEEIGKGGQGQVHLAVDTRLGRRVALKLLSHRLVSERARQRMRREADSLSRVEHPGICTIFEVGEADGLPFLAMRYVHGEPLSNRIAASRDAAASEGGRVQGIAMPDTTTDQRPSGASAGGDGAQADGGERAVSGSGTSGSGARRSMQRIVAMFERAARALHAAHMAGVVHRDVKPQNILITPGGDPVLVDFGLAHVDDDSADLTRTGDLIGTPAYMSPEQLVGRRADRRTDLWSLGVTLYESLTLDRPFRLADPDAGLDVLHRLVTSQRPADPRGLNAAVPRDLVTVLEKAMAPEPEGRYATALEFAEDLAAVRESRPVTARPVSVFGRAVRWARRQPAQAALAVVLVVSLPVVAGLVGYLVAQRPIVAAGRAAEQRAALDAMLRAGFAQLGSGNSAQARGEFVRARELAPDSEDALVGELLCGVFGGDAAAVVERVRDLEAEQGSLTPAVEQAMTLALRRIGGHEEADARAERAGTSSSLAAFVQGFAERSRADEDEAGYELASRHFLRAIASAEQPRQIYHFWAARTAAEAGDDEAARIYADAIVELWPDSPDAWQWVGMVLGAFDSAGSLAANERAIELDPDRFDLLLSVGTARLQTGDLDGAKAALSHARTVRPDNADPVVLLGFAEQLGGDGEAAETAYRDGIAMQEDNLFAHSLLTALLTERGDDAAVAAEQTRWSGVPGRLAARASDAERRGELREAIALQARAVEAAQAGGHAETATFEADLERLRAALGGQ